MARFNKKMIAIYSAIIFFVGLDRFLKVFASMDYGRQFNLIGEVLKFSYEPNYYIAFSLPLAGRALTVFIFFIIIVLLLLSLYYYRQQEYSKLPSLWLIILGASSNLFDRVNYGLVVDYLDLKYFTVFNLADVMIVIGVAALIVISYKKQTD